MSENNSIEMKLCPKCGHRFARSAFITRYGGPAKMCQTCRDVALASYYKHQPAHRARRRVKEAEARRARYANILKAAGFGGKDGGQQ